MVTFCRSNLAALLSIGALSGLAGCSSESGSTTPSESQPVANVQFAVTPAGLPTCSKTVDGEIWYVWSSANSSFARVQRQLGPPPSSTVSTRPFA